MIMIFKQREKKNCTKDKIAPQQFSVTHGLSAGKKKTLRKSTIEREQQAGCHKDVSA